MRGMKIRYRKEYSKTDAEALNSLNNPDNKRSFSIRNPVISRIGYTMGALLLAGGIMFGPSGVLAKKKGAEPSKKAIVDQVEVVHKDLSIINELLALQNAEFGDLPDIIPGVFPDEHEVIQLKKDLKPLGINLDDYLEEGKVTMKSVDMINAKLDELSASASSEEVASSLAGLAPVKEKEPEAKPEEKPPVTAAVPKKEEVEEVEVEEEETPAPAAAEVEEEAHVAVTLFTPDMAMDVFNMADGVLKNYDYVFMGKGYLKNIQKVPALLDKYEKAKSKTKLMGQLRSAMPWTEGMSDEQVVEQAGYVTAYFNLGKLSRIYELASQGNLKGKEAKEFRTLCKSFGLKIGKKITDENYQAAIGLAQTEMQSSIMALGEVVLGGTLTMNTFNSHISAGEYEEAAGLLASELELSLHIMSMGVVNYKNDVNVPAPIIADFLSIVRKTNPFSVKENLLIGLETLDAASRHLVNGAKDYTGPITTDAELLGNIEYMRYQITTGKVSNAEVIGQAVELVKDIPGMDDYIADAESLEQKVSSPELSGAAFAPISKGEGNRDVALALLSIAEVKAANSVHETEGANVPAEWAGYLLKAGDPVGAMFFANLALNKILPYHNEVFQKYVYSNPKLSNLKNWQHIMASELESPGLSFVPLHKMSGTVFAYSGELGTEGGISVYTGRLDPNDSEVAPLVNMPQAIWTTYIPEGHNPFLEGEYPSEMLISGLEALPDDTLRYHTNPDIYKTGLAPASELLESKADNLKAHNPNSKLLDAYRSLDLPLHHKLYLFDHVAALQMALGEEPITDIGGGGGGKKPPVVPVVDLLNPELVSKGPEWKYVQVSDKVVTQHPDIEDIGYESTGKLGIEDADGNALLDSLGLAIAATNNEMAGEAASALLDVLPASATDTDLTGDDAAKYNTMMELLRQAAEGNKDALDEALDIYSELSDGRIAATTLNVIRAYAFDADAGIINAVELKFGVKTEFILKQKEKEFLMLYLQAAYAQSSLFGTVKEVSVTELHSTGNIEYLEGGEEYDAKLTEKAGQFGFGVISKKPIGKEQKAVWNFSSGLSMSGGTDALVADIEGETEVSSSDFFKIDNISVESTWGSADLAVNPAGGLGTGVLNLVELRSGEWDVKGGAPYMFAVFGLGNDVFDLKLRGGSVLYPRAIPFVGMSGALMLNGWTPFFNVNYTFNVSEKEGEKNVGAISASAGVKTPTLTKKVPLALEVSVTGAALVNESNSAVELFGGNIGVQAMLVIPIDVRKEKPVKEEFNAENTQLIINNAEVVILDAEQAPKDTKKYENNMEKAHKYMERAKVKYEEGDYLDAALNAQVAQEYAEKAVEE